LEGCRNPGIKTSNALSFFLFSVVKDVHYLCVTDIPRSGKPEELRAKYGIDSESIVKMVDQLTVGEMML
jgi:transketolase C-terminal domain/subunit